jgi:hypothetical protein
MGNAFDWLEETVQFERQRANDAEQKVEQLTRERDDARELLAKALTDAILAPAELKALRDVADAARVRKTIDESDEASDQDELAASIIMASTIRTLDKIQREK